MNSRQFLLFQLGTEGVLFVLIIFLAGADDIIFKYSGLEVGVTGSVASSNEAAVWVLAAMIFLFSIVVFSSLADHFMIDHNRD